MYSIYHSTGTQYLDTVVPGSYRYVAPTVRGDSKGIYKK